MQKDVYRVGGSVLLLRKAPQGSLELLLLKKPRKRDMWQLPQGGREGDETLLQGALRELEEETGIRDVAVIGESDLVYQYDFPESYRRFRPDHVRGQRIGFVMAMTDAATKVHVDDNEVNGYQWITVDALPKYVKRKEYLQIVKNLYAEAMDLLSS